MSNHSIEVVIKRVAELPGILAVAMREPDGSFEYRGQEQWRQMLQAAIALYTVSCEESLRISIPQFSIMCFKSPEYPIAVVHPVGHAVSKSLQRTVHRTACAAERTVEKATDATA